MKRPFVSAVAGRAASNTKATAHVFFTSAPSLERRGAFSPVSWCCQAFEGLGEALLGGDDGATPGERLVEVLLGARAGFVEEPCVPEDGTALPTRAASAGKPPADRLALIPIVNGTRVVEQIGAPRRAV